VITALFAGHHHHRPSRDQLASAASTKSVVRKLLPLYQQELLLASSSSIAANQVTNSATYKSAARSIVEIFFFFFLQIKMHLCNNQKLRIDLVQSNSNIYISPESELLQMFFCHLSYPTNVVAHGLIIDPDAMFVC
jgi:hypothetical protein